MARTNEEGDGVYSLEYFRAMSLLDFLGETMGERPWDLESATREVRKATQERDVARMTQADARVSQLLKSYEKYYDITV